MASRASETKTIPTNWAIEVASRMKGARFPLDLDTASERLSGVEIQGRGISYYLTNVDFPLDTPADLLHEISSQLSASKGAHSESWAINVTKAVKGVDFPIERKNAEERLQGISVRGRDISELLDGIQFPLDTPADLLREIGRNSR